MKFLLVIVFLSLTHRPTTKLLLIDMNMKNSVIETEEFEWNQFRNRQFPIYAEDRQAVIESAVKLAKIIDKNPPCNTFDSVAANHSIFRVFIDCQSANAISIRLQTHVDERNITCNFELVKSDDNYRKAQRKLLDFADYLSNQ